jgi:pimeloyl-ACP methyl ester carboxylesterase
MFRHVIRGLSRTHRVIAPDHLGFGLSEKPERAPYRPADHARRLAALIRHLDLGPVTLVVHDVGGPIGLSYAIEHPEDVDALVLFNTWLWSLDHDPKVQRASRLASGPLGRFLYRHLNVSPKLLMPLVFGDRHALRPEIHRHYTMPFDSARERTAPWVAAWELAGSGDWFDTLWQRRAALASKPSLLVWGLQDPAFGMSALARWQDALPGAEVEEYVDVGHVVLEEVGAAVLPRLTAFLRRSRYRRRPDARRAS